MPQPSDPGPSRPGGTRQQSAGQASRPGRGQQKQQIPKKNLLGPGGDPAEGKREIGPKPR